MSDEIFGVQDAHAVDADPTGRRRLLKQMAAGAGGVALVWAAPTLTRTDRASAAASDPGGPGGGDDCSSFLPFEESFDLVGTGSGGGFLAYGPGGDQPGSALTANAPAFSIPVGAGNVDAIQTGQYNTGALLSVVPAATTVIGLGGSYSTGSRGDNGYGAIMATFTMPAGTYQVIFPWTQPSLEPNRPFDITLTGATFATIPTIAPPFVSATTTTQRLLAPAQNSLYTYDQNIVVATAGTVTITLSDTTRAPDGMAFTNFWVTCITP